MPTLLPALFLAALASAPFPSPSSGAALPPHALKPGCPGTPAAVNAPRNRMLAALRRA